MLFTGIGFNSTFNLHKDTGDRVKNISGYPKESNMILNAPNVRFFCSSFEFLSNTTDTSSHFFFTAAL